MVDSVARSQGYILAAHLRLQGCLVYLYIHDIFHAQASFRQTCLTHNISLRCHFMLWFIVNLVKSALVPSELMLHSSHDQHGLGGSIPLSCQGGDDRTHSLGVSRSRPCELDASFR